MTSCGGTPAPAVGPLARPTSAPLQRLQRDLTTLITAPDLQRSGWGVLIRSLARDEALYALNPQKLLTPASNMKIATLAAAASRLGWDFTYETQLLAGGAVEGGVLDGDLVVVGSGDPSLDDWDGAATRLFDGWANQLKAGGVTAVAGRVVGDDNAFEDQLLGAGWAWDDLDKSFATSVGALQFNENTARLIIEPGAAIGDSASVALAPDGSGLVVRNLARTAAAGTPVSLVTRRATGTPFLELRGELPLGSAPVIRNVSVYNPTLYFVTALRERLLSAGIEIRGGAVDVDELTDGSHQPRRLLVSHQSPPLSDLAHTMIKVSQNLFAESLLNTIGGREGPGLAGGMEAGRLVVRSLLSEWTIPEAALVVADGSGLSRYNLASPEAFVAILTHVYRDEDLRSRFDAALPVAGRDGTLGQRMKGTAAEGNARGKTGALSNARALSGYVSTADGEPLVFSIMANNFGTTPDIVERTIDAIVVRLAEFRR
jgi:D-alanyl-D-alanine carboxypeptidase/D-alanyl-D-alanine-endopeptidase (penicillin-binding protein 4)